MTATSAGQGDIFVGREREMRELTAALDDAIAGRGRLIMLVGEPGIGKTRTAEKLADIARGRGAEVVWGRCLEDPGAPPFWPWAQVASACIERAGPDVLDGTSGGAAYIAGVVPDLRKILNLGQDALATDDPETARFRLFGAVNSLLKRTSVNQPLLVVLDNLHWSDHSSLRLLEFIAAEATGSRLLLLGTYRDVDIARGHPLFHALGELSRQRLFQRIVLRGLGRASVEDLIEATAAAKPPRELVAQIHAQTEGNPFFIRELLALLHQEGLLAQERMADLKHWEFRLPEGVREVIGRRLDRLSQQANAVLGVASVIGREFDASLLGRLVVSDFPAAGEEGSQDEGPPPRPSLGFHTPGRAAPERRAEKAPSVSPPTAGLRTGVALQLLEEALKARIIEDVPGSSGRYRFAHALIQRTLREEIPTAHRIRLHAVIVAALEELHGARVAEHAPELAYHCAEAEPVIGPEKLIRYSRLAGERALALYAHEEATGHFQRALDSKGAGSRDVEAAEILFGLGRAQSAGTLGEHKKLDALLSAFEILVELGDNTRALAVVDTPELPGMAPGELVDRMLAKALELAPEGTVEQARILARAGLRSGHLAADYATAEGAFRRALGIARRKGDTFLEMWTLERASSVARVHLRWDLSEERASKALELAVSANNPRAECMAHSHAGLAALRRGDLRQAGFHADEGLRLAESTREASRMLPLGGMAGLLYRVGGRWDQARDVVDRCLTVCLTSGANLPALPFLAVRIAIESETGEPGRAENFARQLLPQIRFRPSDATMASSYCAFEIALSARADGNADLLLGAANVASEALAAIHATPYEKDMARAVLSLRAIHNGDGLTARELYEDLVHIRRAFIGPVAGDRLLGLLKFAIGQPVEAAIHFEDALALCREAAYGPELAWSCHDYAEMLLTKRGAHTASEVAKARDLLDQGEPVARKLGMKALTTKLTALREKPAARRGGRPDFPGGLTEREVEVLRLIAAGKSNREIGEALVISENTVIRHVSNIFSKTGVTNRTEAGVYASKNGILSNG